MKERGVTISQDEETQELREENMSVPPCVVGSKGDPRALYTTSTPLLSFLSSLSYLSYLSYLLQHSLSPPSPSFI